MTLTAESRSELNRAEFILKDCNLDRLNQPYENISDFITDIIWVPLSPLSAVCLIIRSLYYSIKAMLFCVAELFAASNDANNTSSILVAENDESYPTIILETAAIFLALCYPVIKFAIICSRIVASVGDNLWSPIEEQTTTTKYTMPSHM